MLTIYQPSINHISTISQPYTTPMLTVYQQYTNQISTIYQPYTTHMLTNILTIY